MAKILIADDTPDSLLVLVRSLELAGHDVISVADGARAVDEFQNAISARARFDLVILDLAMPNLNGFQAADKIRALWIDQKIAFLTAFDEPLSVGRAQAGGAVAFWKKPILPADLCAGVARLL